MSGPSKDSRRFRRTVVFATIFAGLPVVACGVSDGAARVADRGTGSAGGGSGGMSAGGGGPVIELPTEVLGCDGTRPCGKGCNCAYTDFAGKELRCSCLDSCWLDSVKEPTTGKAQAGSGLDCLAMVKDRGAQTTDPTLASCGSFVCTYLPAHKSGELMMPAEMVCTGKECVPTDPPPVVDPPPDFEIPTGGTGGAAPKCGVPVPGAVTLPGPIWGESPVNFRVPFEDYAFATVHAWYLTSKAGYSALSHIDPSFLLATSLKEAFMGCSAKLPPYDAYKAGTLMYRSGNSVDKDGCFQIESTTGMVEICQKFDELFGCVNDPGGMHAKWVASTDQKTTGRDNFASSAVLAAYYYMWAFGITTNIHPIPAGMPGAPRDLNQWFETAADPLAVEKGLALVYNQGAWGANFNPCHENKVEACGVGYANYVPQIAGYVELLRKEIVNENCYDEPISVEHVKQYVNEVAPMYKGVDVKAVEAAGVAAFEKVAKGAATVNFQAVGHPVVSAVVDAINKPMYCPETAYKKYNLEAWVCPPGGQKK